MFAFVILDGCFWSSLSAFKSCQYLEIQPKYTTSWTTFVRVWQFPWWTSDHQLIHLPITTVGTNPAGFLCWDYKETQNGKIWLKLIDTTMLRIILNNQVLKEIQILIDKSHGFDDFWTRIIFDQCQGITVTGNRQYGNRTLIHNKYVLIFSLKVIKKMRAS